MKINKHIKKDIKKIVIAGSLNWINEKEDNITIFGSKIPSNVELFYFCQDYSDMGLIAKKKLIM